MTEAEKGRRDRKKVVPFLIRTSFFGGPRPGWSKEYILRRTSFELHVLS